jgi:hypothetical protein
MRFSRETAYKALYDLLLTTQPPTGMLWKITGRQVKHWDDVSTADQPALFMHQGPQFASQQLAMGATQWKLTAGILVYFRCEACPVETPAVIAINSFIDNFEKILQPFPGARQTLGGIVQHAWIDGTVYFDDGIDDNQCFILIPVTMLSGV